MLGYYHTILATVIRFSGTGIRCGVTTIRYSRTGIRFSRHRIPVTHGEREVEGLKRPAEWLTRIRCLPGNAVKSGLKAKKVTTPISYQDQGCDVRFIMRSIYFHFFFFRASDQYFDFRISLHQIDDTHDGVNLFFAASNPNIYSRAVHGSGVFQVSIVNPVYEIRESGMRRSFRSVDHDFGSVNKLI